jgi:predicted MPP superfamily phosphohydrolase
MVFKIIIFICLALFILAFAHYFLYVSINRLFNISNQDVKTWLSFLFFLFALSFIAASFLAAWQDNFITGIFYISSSFWLGLMTNLILAVIASRLTIWALKNFNFNPGDFLIASAFFILAFIFSIYGAWNAFNPVIKIIEVEIKNLPRQWQNKTIVQLSDIHLGRIYKKDFFNKIIAEVNHLNPEIVVITGDLFDGAGDNLAELAGPLNNIKAEQGVYFVTGNHEAYLGLEKAFDILSETSVKILNDELLDINGLQLIGVSYSQFGETAAGRVEADIISKLKKLNFAREKPSILLCHAPVKIRQIAEAGINLQLSGHTHKGQIYPFGLITKLIYKGYDYGLHKIGDYNLYTTAGIGTWGPPMRIGNNPEIVKIILK